MRLHSMVIVMMSIHTHTYTNPKQKPNTHIKKELFVLTVGSHHIIKVMRKSGICLSFKGRLLTQWFLLYYRLGQL